METKEQRKRHNEANKRWRERNPEKVRASRKRNSQTQAFKESQKKYREKHREEINAYIRTYNKEMRSTKNIVADLDERKKKLGLNPDYTPIEREDKND